MYVHYKKPKMYSRLSENQHIPTYYCEPMTLGNENFRTEGQNKLFITAVYPTEYIRENARFVLDLCYDDTQDGTLLMNHVKLIH